jgi:Mce-associated membrane protein
VPMQRPRSDPHSIRRRPRVAGRRPSTDRPGQLDPHGNRPGAIALDDPTVRPAEVVVGEKVVAGDEVVQPAGRARWSIPVRVALVVVTLIALGLAAWWRGETHALLGSAAASNRALLDVGTTAEISGQVRDAVERVFSYDFARLDENERAATAVITGPFAVDYRRQFARVRELAPGQQVVVVATVPALAVKVLDGDRAIVVVFIDQQANRSGQAQPLEAAGRLRVTAQRVTGIWKIADVEPF